MIFYSEEKGHYSHMVRIVLAEKDIACEIKEFDPSLIQQLLSTMSGGMAVALYTTLAGLLTSSLLKVQYYFLDSVLVSLVNQLTKELHAHDKDQS